MDEDELMQCVYSIMLKKFLLIFKVNFFRQLSLSKSNDFILGSLAVEGLNHSAGVKLRQKIALKNSVSVQKLVDAGAIPLLVSNTPEFCLNWETTNKLIGTTNNPYDLKKTVGGSSGGEVNNCSSNIL